MPGDAPQEKGFNYELGRAEDLQTVITIPGWTDVHALIHYRNLDAHGERTPSGRRTPCMMPQDDGTFDMALIFDGEMNENQQKPARQHAAIKRYGEEATITVGAVTPEEFKPYV